MSVDDRVYLGHMLDLCAKIHQRVARCSRADFDRSEDLRIVITHLIQTLGEAARHVSADLRRRHPEVPYNDIIGMRHRIVHDYFSVDEDLVWDVAVIEVPALERLVAATLASHTAEEPDETDAPSLT